ncbi:MAG TPA: hypothetical protein VIJ75_21255 [Hanamia sp.]
MAKQEFQINASALKKIHGALKKLETKNPKMLIGKMKPTHFLSASVKSLSEVQSATSETKQIILNISGDFSTKPDDLNDSTLLKDNLNFGDDEFSLLQTQFDTLVKKYKSSASVTSGETNKCNTVGDCAKLVSSKTTADYE